MIPFTSDGDVADKLNVVIVLLMNNGRRSVMTMQ